MCMAGTVSQCLLLINYRDFSVHGIFPSLGFGLIQVHFSLCFSTPA